MENPIVKISHSSPDTNREGPYGIAFPELEGDVGYDLYAAQRKSIPPHSAVLVPTNVSIEMPGGIWAEIKDRSSMALRGLFVHGGVIDTNYRGEIVVVIYNGFDIQQTIQPDQKIAQIVFRPVVKPDLLTVDSIELDTERGDRGFGSTGE